VLQVAAPVLIFPEPALREFGGTDFTRTSPAASSLAAAAHDTGYSR